MATKDTKEANYNGVLLTLEVSKTDTKRPAG